MSMPQSVSFECPECGQSAQAELPASVNAGRQPGQRAAILDGSFLRHACPCGTTIRLAPGPVSYLDAGRKQWLVVQPYEGLPAWREHEAHAQATFDMALGAQAPQAAQEIGEGISPRVVFGWHALREKLVAQELGIDDVVLECAKMMLMKQEAIMPQAGHDLRLTGERDGALLLEALEVESLRPLNSYGVPRALCDEIAADAGGAWTPFKAQLTAGPFVDMQRLFWDGDA